MGIVVQMNNYRNNLGGKLHDYFPKRMKTTADLSLVLYITASQLMLLHSKSAYAFLVA